MRPAWSIRARYIGGRHRAIPPLRLGQAWPKRTRYGPPAVETGQSISEILRRASAQRAEVAYVLQSVQPCALVKLEAEGGQTRPHPWHRYPRCQWRRSPTALSSNWCSRWVGASIVKLAGGGEVISTEITSGALADGGRPLRRGRSSPAGALRNADRLHHHAGRHLCLGSGRRPTTTPCWSTTTSTFPSRSMRRRVAHPVGDVVHRLRHQGNHRGRGHPSHAPRVR